ncbi:MAG: hypothetical protein ACOYJG_06735 [Prevotella sp.]|jgi:hypothetical protein
MKRQILAGLLLIALSVSAETENDTVPLFEGEFATEVNYGHYSLRQHPVLDDFPHITVGGALNFKHGWRVEAEFEYERFHEDGEWGNDFKENFSTNRLSLTKAFQLSPITSLFASAGILPIPVGLTNSGGPALTIYDPASEMVMLPMTWHDGGITVCAQTGSWQFLVGTYVYGRAPLRDSRMAGGAARVDYTLPIGLRLGTSCFYGNSYSGMLSLNIEAPEGKRHEFYGAFDADYVKNGFTIDGSAIYSHAYNKNSYGLEAGYNVFHHLLESVELIPFVRYDGVFDHGEEGFNRYTVGMNIAPWGGLILKAEYAWHHENGAHTERQFNCSVGY